jgi:hypothetical protein
METEERVGEGSVSCLCFSIPRQEPTTNQEASPRCRLRPRGGQRVDFRRGSSPTYTLTAVSSSGKKATATITVTVNAIAPTISVAGTSFSFLVGAKILEIVPTLGPSVTSVSISPDITTTGLTFNANTGKISGTPTSAEIATS